MARIDQTSNSLAVDTDVLFVNVSNNRVGINQSNPNTPLHVVGATTIDGGLTSTLGVIQGVVLQLESGAGGSLVFSDGTSMTTANNNLGTVTSITAGTGLSGGTITVSGTIDLADTSVSAGSYGSSTAVATFTVDAQGRLTAAATSLINFPFSNWRLTGDTGTTETVSDNNLVTLAGGTAISSVASASDTVTFNLDDTAVTPATYGSTTQIPVINVDQQGRITLATNTLIAFPIDGTIAAGQVAYGANSDTIEGSNDLFFDDANSRLGIGTNTPASSLHVIGVDDDNPEIRVQRSGVTAQYVSIMNEDASGAFISGESAGGNRKTLFLQSVHDGSGAAGSANISIRTGAASSPTERISISDNENMVIVQSGSNLIVDDGFRVGFTSNINVSDYSISANKGASAVSGGLFSTSIGESAIGNTNAGWWLTAAGMNTTSKYTPAIKFGSTDTAFTTDNPKYLAGIVGRSTETYAADTDGGMAMDFLTFPANGGANGGPTTRMTIDQGGLVGIGTTTPEFYLDVSGAASNTVGIFRSTDATARISFFDNSTSSNTHVGIGAIANDLVLWAGNSQRVTLQSGGNISFETGKLDKYNGSAPTDGQLLIGDAAGGVWDAATLTAGSGISITNGAGAITIAATGGGGGTDELVKTSASDAAAGYLETKITQGANVSILVNLDPISGEQNLVVSASDTQVAGSFGDLTPGPLDQKMVAGAGISLAVVNDPLLGDQVQVTATGGGGGGTPAGSNTQVQFNDGGAFGASADVTYSVVGDEFTLGGANGRTTFVHFGSMIINGNGGSGRIQGRDLTMQSDMIMVSDDPAKSVGFYGSGGISQYTVGDPGVLPPDPAALQAWLVELYNALGPAGMNIIA